MFLFFLRITRFGKLLDQRRDIYQAVSQHFFFLQPLSKQCVFGFLKIVVMGKG